LLACRFPAAYPQVFGQVIEGLEVLEKIESAGEKRGLRLVAEVKIVDSGQMDPEV